LNPTDQLLHRLSQLLYRCLEEAGSTKAALYLAQASGQDFQLISHYGWPRTALPPQLLPADEPLLKLVQRERHSLALNDSASYPELRPFSQGKLDARFFLVPIYDHGDWIGLLVQRDPTRGESYSLEQHEAVTQNICEDIIRAVKYAPPPVVATPEPPPPVRAAPSPVRQWDPIRVPAPPTFPEQRTFFWETARQLCRMVPISALALWVQDPDLERPVLAYSALPLSPDLEHQILAWTLAQMQSRQPASLQLVAKSEHYDRNPILGPMRTLLPILLEEQSGGADLLMVFRVEDNPFTLHEQDAIRGVAKLLGLYLEEGRLHERYHQSFLSVSHRILASAGEKVPYIRAQSINTAELSRSLARRLELSSPEVEAVTISAILHDVGTLLLDRRILEKPRLTAEDREHVHAHPVLASAFLKDFRFPFDVIRIIRHHHEQWDGNGYPDGIKGDRIPVESRIIHLVESFQIMLSGTSYRAPKPVTVALAELRQLSGIHFDPRMVEEFIQMVAAQSSR
jgi:putative nucleotidyltransferase with HDIG domain